MSVSEVVRELGIRWKQAPIELKSKYEQAASEKKQVYQVEMAFYKTQTSMSSSPPETPRTPSTPRDYHTLLSLPMQTSSEIQFDPIDPEDDPGEFDMLIHRTDD